MNQFSLTQRRRILFILLILSLVGAGGTVASQFVFRAKAQQIRTSNVSNVVRGYLAVSVGDTVKASSLGAVSTSVGPGKTAASFNRAPASRVDRKDIYLPGVTVFLDDPQTQKRSREVRTDLSGRFTLYAPEPSRYRLCWKSEVYDNGCTQVFVSAGSSPQFVSTVDIPVPAKTDFVTLVGQVTAADGTSVRTFDPMLNINAFATVSLEDDQANRLAGVYVNNFGDYLLPYVPTKQRVTLTARVEGAKLTQEIRPEAGLEKSQLHRINLKIENNRPRLDPLTAVDSSNRHVQNAAPGAEIRVVANARDIDGDVLSYSWFVDPGAGQLSQITGPSAKWRLPTTPGVYPVTVVAFDSKGGYDKAILSVLVGEKGIPFGGLVVEPDGTPVDKAQIEIVGNPVIETSTDGRFAIYAIESDRYVLNVRKKGYALNSQVYDRGITGGRWKLRRAQLITIDPTRDQVVANQRTQADCPGPDSARASLGVAGDSLKVPRWQDGNGRAIDPPSTYCRTCSGPKGAETELFVTQPGNPPIVMPRDLKIPKCGPGASVHFPANSILDADGNPVTAPFEAAIATVDLLSPQQMPGDYSVFPTGSMESFGAGSLDLPAGFKLSSSANVTVTIPVDRSRLMGGTLPASVPLLSYDETKGLWNQDGTLDLKTVSGVKSYVGQVKHFSGFNADNVKTEASACLRVFSPNLPTHYNLEVAAPFGGTGAPKVLTKEIVQAPGELGENVIYNLPSNTNITLAPMSKAEAGHPPELFGFYVVNSGDPQFPNSSPSPPPGPAYTSCKNFVVLEPLDAPKSPFGGEFLHGLGFINAFDLGLQQNVELTPESPPGTELKNQIVAAATNYYNQVDPNTSSNPADDRDTFEKFKAKNGFLDPSLQSQIINARYANSGDLGFGRDMHCLKKPNGDVACYVTNYGTGYVADHEQSGSDDQQDANAAGNRADILDSKEVATVAMEYSAIEGDPSNKVVKFFVYKKALTNAAGASYARSISANLDGRGERPVPQLCMICHGGRISSQSAQGVPTFGTAEQVNLHARFLPFDYRLFTFPTVAGLSQTDQDASIKNLNQQIVKSAPPNNLPEDPIVELIDGLYAANPAHQNPNFTPAGWQNGASAQALNQADFYQKVIANGCRTCHIANPFTQLQFRTSDEFVNLSAPAAPTPDTGGAPNHLMLGTAQMRVCGDYIMPHALRTHDIFWGSYSDISQTPIAGVIGLISMRQEFQDFGNNIPAGGTGTWKANLCTSFTSSTTPPSNFYKRSIQTIWNSKCVVCHVGANAPQELDLSEPSSSSWQLLLTPAPHSPRVIPHDDVNSLVIRKITATDGSRMPQNCYRPPAVPGNNLPCLSQADIDIIKAWIRSGAN